MIANKQSMDPIINKLGSNNPAFFIPNEAIMLDEKREKNSSPALMIQKMVATIVVVSMRDRFA
jgi:hypothetical protein